MPQMAPLNWLSLMLFFSIVLIMFNVMNFYSFSYPIKKKKKETKKTSINWKW